MSKKTTLQETRDGIYHFIDSQSKSIELEEVKQSLQDHRELCIKLQHRISAQEEEILSLKKQNQLQYEVIELKKKI